MRQAISRPGSDQVLVSRNLFCKAPAAYILNILRDQMSVRLPSYIIFSLDGLVHFLSQRLQKLLNLVPHRIYLGMEKRESENATCF